MENEIAEWAVKIGRQCKESNVNDVFISSLICRTQKRLNVKFIGNSNICAENLFEGGLHLNGDGKVILAVKSK